MLLQGSRQRHDGGGCSYAMSKRMNYLWPVAAALLIAAPVQAETWDQKVDRHFSLLDTDGDGKISKVEAAAHPPLSRHFRAMDKNKDGGISAVEFMEADFTNFSRLDTNGDGFITQDELSARMGR